MPYVPPVDWEDTPSTDTPLNDTNITAMETALALGRAMRSFAVNTTPVASATSIDPPDNYLVHTVSGTADIETIAAQAAGKVIVLLFSGDAATTGLVTDSGNLSSKPTSSTLPATRSRCFATAPTGSRSAQRSGPSAGHRTTWDRGRLEGQRSRC